MNRSLRFISAGENEKAFQLAAVNKLPPQDNITSIKIMKTGGRGKKPNYFHFTHVLLIFVHLSVFLCGSNSFMDIILHSDFFFTLNMTFGQIFSGIVAAFVVILR